MPLDEEPSPAGNVLLREDGIGIVLGNHALLELEPGTMLFVPHWSTCPDADLHRRRKR